MFEEITIVEITAPTDEERAALLAMWCVYCDADLLEEDPVFVWGEPISDGTGTVAVNVTCSEAHMRVLIASYATSHDRDVMVLHKVR